MKIPLHPASLLVVQLPFVLVPRVDGAILTGGGGPARLRGGRRHGRSGAGLLRFSSAVNGTTRRAVEGQARRSGNLSDVEDMLQGILDEVTSKHDELARFYQSVGTSCQSLSSQLNAYALEEAATIESKEQTRIEQIALAGSLEAHISALSKQEDSAQLAYDDTVAQRSREHTAWVDESADLQDQHDAVENALQVLRNVGKSSPDVSALAVRTNVQTAVTTRSQSRSSSSPGFDEIVGRFTHMQTTLTSDRQEAEAEYKGEDEQYLHVISSHADRLSHLHEQIARKNEERAEAQSNADIAKEEKELRESLANTFHTVEDKLWLFCGSPTSALAKATGDIAALVTRLGAETQAVMAQMQALTDLPQAPMGCPSPYVSAGGPNADIAGCGLTACDDRYGATNITECAQKCTDFDGCVSFSWAPLNGDQNHPGDPVCTLYDQQSPTRVHGPNQVFCAFQQVQPIDSTSDGTMLLDSRNAQEASSTMSDAEDGSSSGATTKQTLATNTAEMVPELVVLKGKNASAQKQQGTTYHTAARRTKRGLTSFARLSQAGDAPNGSQPTDFASCAEEKQRLMLDISLARESLRGFQADVKDAQSHLGAYENWAYTIETQKGVLDNYLDSFDDEFHGQGEAAATALASVAGDSIVEMDGVEQQVKAFANASTGAAASGVTSLETGLANIRGTLQSLQNATTKHSNALGGAHVTFQDSFGSTGDSLDGMAITLDVQKTGWNESLVKAQEGEQNSTEEVNRLQGQLDSIHPLCEQYRIMESRVLQADDQR